MKTLYETIYEPIGAAFYQYTYARVLEELIQDYNNSKDKNFASEVLTRCILDYVQETYAGWMYDSKTNSMIPAQVTEEYTKYLLENKFNPSKIFSLEGLESIIKEQGLSAKADRSYKKVVEWYKFPD